MGRFGIRAGAAVARCAAATDLGTWIGPWLPCSLHLGCDPLRRVRDARRANASRRTSGVLDSCSRISKTMHGPSGLASLMRSSRIGRCMSSVTRSMRRHCIGQRAPCSAARRLSRLRPLRRLSRLHCRMVPSVNVVGQIPTPRTLTPPPGSFIPRSPPDPGRSLFLQCGAGLKDFPLKDDLDARLQQVRQMATLSVKRPR